MIMSKVCWLDMSSNKTRVPEQRQTEANKHKLHVSFILLFVNSAVNESHHNQRITDPSQRDLNFTPIHGENRRRFPRHAAHRRRRHLQRRRPRHFHQNLQPRRLRPLLRRRRHHGSSKQRCVVLSFLNELVVVVNGSVTSITVSELALKFCYLNLVILLLLGLGLVEVSSESVEWAVFSSTNLKQC